MKPSNRQGGEGDGKFWIEKLNDHIGYNLTTKSINNNETLIPHQNTQWREEPLKHCFIVKVK